MKSTRGYNYNMTNILDTYIDPNADLIGLIANLISDDDDIDPDTFTADDLDTDYLINTDITDDDDRIDATCTYLNEFISNNRAAINSFS